MGLLDVNFVAVLVAGVLGFMVGAVWYQKWAFGEAWMKHNNIDEQALEENPPGARPFVVGLICSLVTAWVLAAMLNVAGIGGVPGAVLLGVVLWLGFTACTSLTDIQFSGHPLGGWAIDAGHRLVAAIIMAVVLGLWP